MIIKGFPLLSTYFELCFQTFFYIWLPIIAAKNKSRDEFMDDILQEKLPYEMT